MITTTGCDGIMVGRAALGNPWIFRDIISYVRHENMSPPLPLAEREKVIREHMNVEILYSGEYLGIRNFRKHLLWYTKGLKDSSQFRQKLSHILGKDQILKEVADFFLSREGTVYQQ